MAADLHPVLMGIRERLRSGRGVRAAVVGAARSGRAAANLLVSKGAEVCLLDERQAALQNPPPGVECGPLSRATCADADLVVLSPGVPRLHPALEEVLKTQRLVGEVELASWFLELPLIGVTGTNGKSTTTALIGDLLQAGGYRPFVGGNYGRPFSELALSSEAVNVAVLELSSYQLESIESASFQIGIWLNLTADHLDRYPSLEAYAAAKARLFERVPEAGWVVASADDSMVRAWAERVGRPTRWFSGRGALSPGQDGASVVGRRLHRANETYVVDGPGLLGAHNGENVAAAVETARLWGVQPPGVQAALTAFAGLAHRLALVHEADGVRWYDDSKATNVASAVTSVRAMTSEVVLIAGGRDKGGDWSPLVEAAETRVHRVFAIGEAAPQILAAFRRANIRVDDVGTLRRAVQAARDSVQRGQVVLLAPACASFDQFESFEHRGRVFTELARVGDGA